MDAQHKMREWTYFEGEWYVESGPMLAANVHALWMSSSVFDGARWFDGVAPDLLPHCRRLNDSATVMGLLPTLTAEQMVEIIRDGLRRFAQSVPIYIKPSYFATRGNAQWVPPDPESTTFILSLKETPLSDGRGISLSMSPFRRPSAECMPTDAKSGCLYPNNARALLEAGRRGFENALLLDMLGNVAETATSNVFLVKDSVVRTPALNGTFLAGITRARIIHLLREKGLEVQECSLRVADLAEADEIFTTGNMQKVVPVRRFEGKELPPGPIAKQARELYFSWARS